MIQNDKQYDVTKYWIKEFEATLVKLTESRQPTQEIDPQLLRLEVESIKSILADLRQQLTDYEASQKSILMLSKTPLS